MWAAYYENGEYAAIGKFLNGTKTGKWKYFFKDKRPRADGVYENGKKTGQWRIMNEEGILFKVNYNIDLLNGEFNIYSNVNKYKIASGRMNNNIPEGEWSIYINSDKEYLRMKGKYIKGKKDGIWTTYHEYRGNKIKSKHLYKYGKWEKLLTMYDENGNELSANQMTKFKYEGYLYDSDYNFYSKENIFNEKLKFETLFPK